MKMRMHGWPALGIVFALACGLAAGQTVDPRWVEVQIQEPNGKPAANLLVELLPFDGATLGLPSGRLPIFGRYDRSWTPQPRAGAALVAGRTDPAGTVRLPLPSHGEWLLFARREDEVAQVLLASSERRRVQQAVWKLKPKRLGRVRTVIVTALDPQQQPLGGMAVVLRDPDRLPMPGGTITGVVDDTAGFVKGVTNARGEVRFLLQHHPDGPFAAATRLEALVVRHGGDPVEVIQPVGPGRVMRIPVEVPDTTSVRWVFDGAESLAPHERAHVEWESIHSETRLYVPDKLNVIHVSWNWQEPKLRRTWYFFGHAWYAEVGPEGRVAGGFTPGMRVGVTVEALGRMPRSALITIPKEGSLVRRSLPLGPRLARVRFELRDEDGAALTDFPLRAGLSGGAAKGRYVSSEFEFLNDFELEALGGGRYEITVPPQSPTTLTLRSRAAWNMQKEEADRKLELSLPALKAGQFMNAGSHVIKRDPHFVAGFVVDGEGAPVANAHIRIKPAESDSAAPGLNLTARSGKDGRFEIRAPRITDREHMLFVRSGSDRKTEVAVHPTRTDLKIILP